jgi:ligand-binding SRPBCC domain-containing protein
MPRIELATFIRAPIERVFDLARSIDLHSDSLAFTGERAVGGVTSGLIRQGETVTWRARHFSVWQGLTSRITHFEPPHRFSDQMVRGAFRRFDHDHFFTPQDSGTLMRNVFDFDAPLGPLGHLANWLFLTRYMRRFLLVRNAALKAVAESDRWRRYLPSVQS